MIAPDARTHPATRGFADDYLAPLEIRSLLDVCFSVNGVPFGMFSCEQIGVPMDWTLRQLQQLRQIGSRASLTLVRAAAAATDTGPASLWDTSSPNRFMTMPLPLDGGANDTTKPK